MLAERNTLSLHLMYMDSWFVGTFNSKEIFTIVKLVVDVVDEGEWHSGVRHNGNIFLKQQ